MERRRENRIGVELPGKCRIDGADRQIYFSQISANGCRVRGLETSLQPDDIIEISLGPIGPIDATVRWVRDGSQGVEFASALEPEIVEYFATFLHAAA